MIRFIKHIFYRLVGRKKRYIFSIRKEGRKRFSAKTAWRFDGEEKWIRSKKYFHERADAEKWLAQQELKMKGCLGGPNKKFQSQLTDRAHF